MSFLPLCPVHVFGLSLSAPGGFKVGKFRVSCSMADRGWQRPPGGSPRPCGGVVWRVRPRTFLLGSLSAGTKGSRPNPPRREDRRRRTHTPTPSLLGTALAVPHNDRPILVAMPATLGYVALVPAPRPATPAGMAGVAGMRRNTRCSYGASLLPYRGEEVKPGWTRAATGHGHGGFTSDTPAVRPGPPKTQTNLPERSTSSTR